MKKIESFLKDHDTLNEGIYAGTTMHNVTTFDLRFKKPNTQFITTASAHTIEHIIATLLRNSEYADNIIYFGPMGCRTGFYLLTVKMQLAEVKEIIKTSIIAALEFTEVPGSQKNECGNHLDHDLFAAKSDLKEFLKVLEND